MPSEEGAVRARERIRPYIQPTPAFVSEPLSMAFGAKVWLKVETLNPIASFKLRGAMNSLLVRQASGALRGAVAASTGNHGQGVALAARTLGVACHVFVPPNANAVKLRAMRTLGAEVHEAGRDIDEAKDAASRFATDQGFALIDDGEDLEMMHGAGTLALEVREEVRDVDFLFVPMGSGTLAAGCGAVMKAAPRTCKVVTVQSTGAPAMTLSFHQKKAVSHAISTLADGLVCRVPARAALRGILRNVDQAVAVDDQAILGAVRALLEYGHVVVEPSGAAALAGAWQLRDSLKGTNVVLALTGANISPETLATVLRTKPLFEAPAVKG